MSHDAYEGRPLGWLLALLIAIFGLIAGDMVTDYGSGTTPLHLLVELGVMALSLAGVAVLWGRFRAARKTVTALERDIEAARREAERWRGEAGELLGGLAAAIDRQFARWNLTSAEREIGFLLLQGLSHKEIAAARATSERTVREQARAVYQKGALSGRSALAAFFLGDLNRAARE